MAACQQPPFCSVQIKSVATDSKDGNETHVGLDMETTEKDWDRLGELVKTGISVSLVTMVPIVPVGPNDVGKGDDYRNNGTLKKASEEFNRVRFFVGKDDDDSAGADFLEDIGLIKCLSVLYDVPNPFLYNPALDGFTLPLQRICGSCGSSSGEPAQIKNQGICVRKFETFTLLMSHFDPSQANKTTEQRLREAVQLMRAREESDYKRKAKAKERKKAKAAERFNCSSKKTKNTEKSDTKLISKTAEVDASDSRKKAKTTQESDSRKRANAREKTSAKQELKTTVGVTAPGKELMMDKSEVGKGTDHQEKASSRQDSKNVRTCMTCGIQEPAPKVFKKCRRCKDEGCPDPPYYCGRDCQVLDWTARHRQQHEKNNAGDTAKS